MLEVTETVPEPPKPPAPPKLSVLMPSIPSRFHTHMVPLYTRLLHLVGDRPVEILCLMDNKKRSIGLKRDALLQSARGDYVAFVDDDDQVTDDYITSLLHAIETLPGVDVVTFKQFVTINDGNKFTVDFSFKHEANEEAGYDDNGKWRDIKRKPFHICAWRRDLAQRHRYPDASYGEDWHWARRALEEVRSEARIDKHLHIYCYSDKVTEAALDFAKE